MHQYAQLGDTLYFGFGANLTSGAAGDGASPTFAVRLCGAASNAAPVLTGTPTLLTHASYADGSYEIAVAATGGNGFAAGDGCLVFGGLTISGVIPNTCVGSFKLGPVPADTIKVGGTTQTGRDLGASVLLSSGTGTGQVKLSSGYVAPNWGDVGNPTTAVNLSATNFDVDQIVASVSGAVGSVTAITASGGIVSADIKKVNAITVTGSGTAGSPWGP